MQLDYLQWYPDQDKIEIYGSPVDWCDSRDNPNWTPTEYENVYQKLEWYNVNNCGYDLQLVIP